MRKIVMFVAALGLMLVPGPAEAESSEVVVTASNFRFCTGEVCGPADQGYVRGETGPLAPVDNPLGTIQVEAGDTVTFVYADAMCDAIGGCPGHDIRIENGTTGGDLKGTLARESDDRVSMQVPEAAAPGTKIRVFCAINEFHWRSGMTTVLQVGGGY